jgi:AraC family transcriptional regulator
MSIQTRPPDQSQSPQRSMLAATSTQHQVTNFGAAVVSSEFPLDETHRFDRLSSCQTLQTSAGRNWSQVYVSKQIENPNEGTFLGSPHLLISLTRSGTARVFFDIKSKRYCAKLHPGQLNILAPNEPAHVVWERRVHTTHLYLRDSLLEDVATDLGGKRSGSINVLSKLAFVDPLLEGLVTAICDATESSAEGSDPYVEHLARATGYHVIRKYSNLQINSIEKDSPGQLTKTQMTNFRDMIEGSMSQKLTLADLAAGSGLSNSHFAHLFKKTTGRTPYQYLLHSRIQRARYLLIKTSMPVIKIAVECGFTDQVHFTRVFSKIVGQPPATFRKLADS